MVGIWLAISLLSLPTNGWDLAGHFYKMARGMVSFRAISWTTHGLPAFQPSHGQAALTNFLHCGQQVALRSGQQAGSISFANSGHHPCPCCLGSRHALARAEIHQRIWLPDDRFFCVIDSGERST
jgi:hypothetical protein